MLRRRNRRLDLRPEQAKATTASRGTRHVLSNSAPHGRTKMSPLRHVQISAFPKSPLEFVAIPTAPLLSCSLTAKGARALVTAVTYAIAATHVAAQSSVAGESEGAMPGIQIAREIVIAADIPAPLRLRVVGRVPDRATYLRVSGLPEGARLSHGHPLSSRSWSVAPADGEALQIDVPGGLSGKFELTIALVVVDGAVLAVSSTELVAARPQGALERRASWPPFPESSGPPRSPVGPKLSDASRPATGAPDAQRTLLADGTYAAHARAACGEPFQSVLIKVESGRVSFEHVFQGTSYGWAGTVDETGKVLVMTGSLSGAGSFSDKRIELGYPNCAAAPIVLQVRWRTQ